MKYEDIRDTIKSGDVLLWSERSGFFANIIQIFTRSRFTHVGIAFVIGGRVFVLDAWPGNGVRLHLLSNLTPFFILNMTNKWNMEIEEYALSKVGETYSYIEAIRGFFGIAKRDSNWECAEYVQAVFRSVYPEIMKISPTPGNISKFFVALGATILRVDK